jgi:hypothetical protein
MATTETKVKPAPDMEYITIPERDLFDHPFSGIWINRTEYKPGTHLVEKDVAMFLKERLDIWQTEQIRQLRPNADKRVSAAFFEK